MTQVARSVHYNDPFRKYVNVIIKKFPKEMHGEFSKGHDDYEDFRYTHTIVNVGIRTKVHI